MKFACKTCPHKPSVPFPPFPTPQQLEAKRCVRVLKFVPRIRAPHMYNATRRLKPRVAPHPVKMLQKNSQIEEMKQSGDSKIEEREGKGMEKGTGWQVVKSKTKENADEIEVKKKKRKPRPGRKRSKKAQTEVSEENQETPKKSKDYVQIMLRDADEREKKLAERKKEEAEEIKEEAKRQKKAIKKINQATSNRSTSSQSTKPILQPTSTSDTLPTTPTATEQNTQESKIGIHKKKRSNRSKRYTTNMNQSTSSTSLIPSQSTASELPPTINSQTTTPQSAIAQSTTAQSTTAQSTTSQSTTAQSTRPQPTDWQVSTAQRKKIDVNARITYKEFERVSRLDYSKLGSLACLPHDTLLQTLSHLSPSEVRDLSLVSKDMHKIAEDGILWRELFSRYYPTSRLTAKNVSEWKLVFHREIDCILDDLTCFHTKLNFEEDILGVPISFTTNPSTGKVDYIYSSLDYMSSTAFHKLKIRKSPFKEAFTHFLPLYITEEHFQKAFPDIKRALIQLSPEYRSSGFDPKMALSVFGKLMNTMITLVMKDGIAASTKTLNGYIAFHRLLLAFVEKYPQLMYEVNYSIEEFIRSDEGRVKSTIPSLGDWIALLSVSNKYTWRHVSKLLIAEALDRNVLFICKEHPSLATLTNISETGVEWTRINQSFEHSLVSIKLLLFHSYFLTCIARPAGTSLAQVADRYDRYFGGPSSKTLDAFQNAVQRIQKMKGWPDFYALAGLPCPSPKEMTQILRENVRNSKKKGYHDNDTNFRNVQASGVSVILNKGDSYHAPTGLNKISIQLSYGYTDKGKYNNPHLLTCSAFEFTKSAKNIGSAVNYVHKSNASGSITHSGDVVDKEKKTVTQTIHVTLHAVSSATHFIIFTFPAYL